MVTRELGQPAVKDVPSDAVLIERSWREPGCFAGIFDRHGPEILRYVHARLGPDLAEDITAETFLAAFCRRDRYDTARADARPVFTSSLLRTTASPPARGDPGRVPRPAGGNLTPACARARR